MDNKSFIMRLMVSFLITLIGVSVGYTMFTAYSALSLASDIQAIESVSVQDDPGSFTIGRGRNSQIAIPSPTLKAFTPIDLSGAGVKLSSDAADTMVMKAAGDDITLTGTMYGTSADKMRYMIETAKEPVIAAGSATLNIPGFAMNNKLPAVLQKSDKEYIKNFLMATFDLSGSYLEGQLDKMDATQLKSLCEAIFDSADLTKAPLVSVVRPSTYDLRIQGISNKATKESTGRLLLIAYTTQDVATIDAKLTTILTDPDAKAEMTDAIRYLRTGYIMSPKSKFPVDKQTKTPLVR